MPFPLFTRRRALRLIAPVPPLLALGAIGRETLFNAGAADESNVSDRTMLQALANRGGGRVPRRSIPYRIDGPINLPGGCSLLFDPGVEIVFEAPPPTGARTVSGVFNITGDHVLLGTDSGTITIRAAHSNGDLFAVFIAGRSDITIRNIAAVECSHVFCTAAASDYKSVVLAGNGANVSRRIRIEGGGAHYSALLPKPWQGACVIQFTDDFVVRGSSYVNVAHGVQWWGGDADPKADGALLNERKCRNGRIEDVHVNGAAGCSVWGTMGQAITVARCTGANVGDVGFDAEGSVAVTFDSCVQRDAAHACFASFFFNQTLVFRNCTGWQPRSDMPLFRIFGAATGGNQDITIDGGYFTCAGNEPGTFDDAYCDARTIIVKQARFDNVAIRFHYREHHNISITNNTLGFPRRVAAPFDAILIGRPVAVDAQPGTALVTGNRITSEVRQGVGSRGIHIVKGDSAARVSIGDNQITGFGADTTG